MKKYICALLAFAAITIVSCQKEDKTQADGNDRIESFSAVIDEEMVTRGTYTINYMTNNASFAWDAGDAFLRIVRVFDGASYGNYDAYSYSYSSGSGNSAIFEGSSVGSGYEDINIALFPSSLVWFSGFGGSKISDFYLYMPASMAYNAASPLKNVVPMMGIREGDTYTFKPLTGLLAVTLTNIPADATSVSLSSTNGGICGGQSVRFANNITANSSYDTITGFLGPESKGLRKSWMTNQERTYTFDAGSFTTATFYFPVASSYNNSAVSDPYTNFTISVKGGASPITVAQTGLSLTVERSEIIDLPTINCNYAGTKVTAAVAGDASAIKAYYSVVKGTVTSVRATALSEKSKTALDTAIPDNASGTDITGATDSGSAAAVSAGLSGSGQYYIGIKAFNGTKEVASVIVSSPVSYLAPKAVSSLLNTFSTDGSNYYESVYRTYINGSQINASNGSITIALSDDCTLGNIKITAFCGNTFTSPAYGVYDNSTKKITIPRANVYTDGSSYTHDFCQGGTEFSAGSATQDVTLLVNDNSLYSKYYPISNANVVYDRYYTGAAYGATSRIFKMVAGTAGTTLDIE